jgi:tetratricopeptide (TPR) repeat protein
MTQRYTVSGRRSALVWLAIVLVLVLAIALAAVVFVIGPQQQLRQQVQATAEARQVEVERFYQAGAAFQNAGDCGKAADSFAQVINKEPGYKDAQSRLTQARACQQAAEATATAQAIAMAQATVEAQATATADARALAQAAAVTATAAAEANSARATAEAMAAIKAAYQRGMGYYNLERWAEAKAAFEEVFDADPTYKDVQTKLTEVETKLAEAQKLTPTAVPVPIATPIPPAQTPQIINVALKKPATASLTYKQDTPNKANDGDLETSWNAGTFGPQWWEVELDGATVTRIRLVVHYGATRVEESKYEVRVYYQPDEAVLKEFSKVAKDGDVFTWTLEQAVSNVQKVRVITWSSPSWVAWDEVEIYGYYP